jgi:ketosteroid isomerase-like protein
MEAAVLAVLEQYKQAIEQRDMERLLALFAPDPDIVVIGTGAGEHRVGLADLRGQIDPDRSQPEATSSEWGRPSVSADGSVAWVAVNVVVHTRVAGQEVSLPLRSPAVLERRGADWLVMKAHLSVPPREQAEGKAYPTA